MFALDAAHHTGQARGRRSCYNVGGDRMRVISGGQTGVDRAALDVAATLGLPRGGWCPKGRKAEDGAIDPWYPLDETPTSRYLQRTQWNVRDSDGTLVLTRTELSGGTAQTMDHAKRQGKPQLVVDLWAPWEVGTIRRWLRRHKIRTLNVAGPRESRAPGIYAQAHRCLYAVLAAYSPKSQLSLRAESRMMSGRRSA